MNPGEQAVKKPKTRWLTENISIDCVPPPSFVGLMAVSSILFQNKQTTQIVL